MGKFSFPKRGHPMRKRGKAQAALEFLTTYGWAFLIILIMIGALAYFGILNPDRILPERCNFPATIGCIDYLIDSGAADSLTLRLKNSVGEVIDVTSLTARSEGATSVTCVAADLTPLVGWSTGGVTDIELGTCFFTAAGFRPGNKEKLIVELTYNTVRSGPSFPHDVEGEVYASVQEI